jgi:hypothetical protein
MTEDTNTTSAPLRKEPAPELQKLLELVAQLDSQMVRLEVTVAALKIGYYALTQGLNMIANKAE